MNNLDPKSGILVVTAIDAPVETTLRDGTTASYKKMTFERFGTQKSTVEEHNGVELEVDEIAVSKTSTSRNIWDREPIYTRAHVGGAKPYAVRGIIANVETEPYEIKSDDGSEARVAESMTLVVFGDESVDGALRKSTRSSERRYLKGQKPLNMELAPSVEAPFSA
jgi:hypothetical protein